MSLLIGCVEWREVAPGSMKAVISTLRRRTLSAEPNVPKYQQIFEKLSREVLSGRYQPGQKFPSEAALVQQFQTSRITIGRAVRELAARGLVERIAGSGTYVRTQTAGNGLLFGLLIPDLGSTEIFDPICHGIASARQASEHALLWGHTSPDETSQAKQALGLCDQFIARNVAGVFFAPLETGRDAEETNLTIVSRLEEARIPIVMLDRCILPYPRRGRHDLVGIDHRRAGFIATEHLLRVGAERIAFLAYTGSAPSVEARIAGFRDALRVHGSGGWELARVYRLEAATEASVQPLLADGGQKDAFVCANDRTAGHLMRALLALGRRIPEDVRIVGIDDVEYASLLPIPLTTVHQPCREIGEAAMAAMLDRIANPNILVRDILLECRLVVRESCGAQSG